LSSSAVPKNVPNVRILSPPQSGTVRWWREPVDHHTGAVETSLVSFPTAGWGSAAWKSGQKGEGSWIHVRRSASSCPRTIKTRGTDILLHAKFVWLAHYPHDEPMARVADELGLMVRQDLPVYWA
jgi:hypothetical protein